VQIIEYNTNALKNLGLDWSQSFGGPNVAVYGDLITNKTFKANPAVVGGPFDALAARTVPGLRAYSGIASIITSQINLALDNGDAYMVAAPELSARSGGEAKFLSGGEIPVVTTTINGPTVNYKEYGIKLEFKPLADDKGNVVVALKTEISAIDPSIAVAGGSPGFLKRASESVVNVVSGQTVAISGLVNDSRSRSRNGLAGLSQVPVLGALFRNESTLNNRRELVIFVTPLVADPASEHNQTMVKRGAELGREFDNAIAR
jgi:pilus assembly protein CpaC